MRRILLILLVMTLLFLASCSSPEAQPPAAEPPTAEPPAADAPGTDASNQEPEIVYVDPEKAYTIYVNDEKIAQAAVYNKGYIEIPIMAVFRALGATVTWISPQSAVIWYQEKEFTLSTTNEMMYFGGKEVLVSDVAGAPYTPIFRMSGTEVFIDQMQLQYFFENDLGASLNWSWIDKEVYVQKIIA